MKDGSKRNIKRHYMITYWSRESRRVYSRKSVGISKRKFSTMRARASRMIKLPLLWCRSVVLTPSMIAQRYSHRLVSISSNDRVFSASVEQKTWPIWLQANCTTPLWYKTEINNARFLVILQFLLLTHWCWQIMAKKLWKHKLSKSLTCCHPSRSTQHRNRNRSLFPYSRSVINKRRVYYRAHGKIMQSKVRQLLQVKTRC